MKASKFRCVAWSQEDTITALQKTGGTIGETGKEQTKGLSEKQLTAAVVAHEVKHSTKDAIILDNSKKGDSGVKAGAAGDAVVQESKKNNEN